MSEDTSVIDSILGSTKKYLGIAPEGYDHFDSELIVLINGVFSTLYQLGVGPIEPFTIDGNDQIWSEFLVGISEAESVKTYMFLKVKILFDPPSNGSVLQAYQELCKEIEWRLQVAVDHSRTESLDE